MKRKKKALEENDYEIKNNSKIPKISTIIDTKMRISLEKEEFSVQLQKNFSFLNSFDKFDSFDSFHNSIDLSCLKLNHSNFNCSILIELLKIETRSNSNKILHLPKKRLNSFNLNPIHTRLFSVKGPKSQSKDFNICFKSSEMEKSKVSKSPQDKNEIIKIFRDILGKL